MEGRVSRSVEQAWTLAALKSRLAGPTSRLTLMERAASVLAASKRSAEQSLWAEPVAESGLVSEALMLRLAAQGPGLGSLVPPSVKERSAAGPVELAVGRPPEQVVGRPPELVVAPAAAVAPVRRRWAQP